MAGLDLQNNPFRVFTPENMDASDVNALFVDPFTDFNKIREMGHTMVNGPRGCGKSMIFRYLLPDCQSLALEKPMHGLPFFSFLISIKNTAPNITELRRLHNQHADVILNEHVLAIFIANKIFESLTRMVYPTTDGANDESRKYLEEIFNPRLLNCGGSAVELRPDYSTPCDIFRAISSVCDDLYSEVVQYVRRLAFSSNQAVPYTSALCGYVDFLFPVLRGLTALSFFPEGPVYLLIDDADYLNRSQTIALNSWVSTRTQSEVSIKISTQLRYKTLGTASGLPIQAPHDFQAINIADVYTTRHGRYLNRVEEIIRLRLEKAGIRATPREFFPQDEGQERRIQEIADTLRSEWEEKGRGYRPHDDVIRYARPEYIRLLGGPSKSRSTYRYSGFEHLVHISSGLVRYFLEPAAVMYDEQQSRNPESTVTRIDPSIQNEVVRNEADNLMLRDFETFRQQEIAEHDLEDDDKDVPQTQMDRLYNLIRALGGIFFLKLISEDSERRVFSVAISGQPAPDVTEAFEFGVRYGYFHRSSIGNKDGTGRTRLFVLTRRLAPHFALDPTTFAGYLWITSELLQDAMRNPDRLLRRIKSAGVSHELDSGQLTLFE